MAGKHFTNTGQILQALFAFVGLSVVIILNRTGLTEYVAQFSALAPFIMGALLIIGCVPIARFLWRRFVVGSREDSVARQRRYFMTAVVGMALCAIGFALFAAVYLENRPPAGRNVKLLHDIELTIPNGNAVFVQGKLPKPLGVVRAVVDYTRLDGDTWLPIQRYELDAKVAPYAGKVLSWPILSRMGPGLNERVRLATMAGIPSGTYRFRILFFIDDVANFQAYEFALAVDGVEFNQTTTISQIELKTLKSFNW